MKRFIIGTLSALALGGLFAPVATAQLNNPETNTVASTSRHRTAPSAFTVVAHAYRGTFADQGIPSYGQLLTQVRQNKVTAADIVTSAVEAGRISADLQDDASFLNAVDLHLDSLARSN